MISVRVSESEYELLKKHYASLGTRSVSDLARAALQRVIGVPATNGIHREPEIQTMDEKLSTLQSQISQLSRALTELKKTNNRIDAARAGGRSGLVRDSSGD